MDKVFSWIRPGFKLVEINLKWNVQVPNTSVINSPFFSSQEIPDSQWKLELHSQTSELIAWHENTVGQKVELADPVLVKISVRNGKGQKVFQHMFPSEPDSSYVSFDLYDEDIIQSEWQQEEGNYNFYCKILRHVENEMSDLPDVAINCSDELSIQFNGLFESMQFSDVIFNVRGRQFAAHKSILSARSKVFQAMFKHPTKENLTNQIKIEDIEPEVFQELLRFIYTGRLSRTTLETMAIGLIIAADKYLLCDLKTKWENYLLCHISPVNCVLLFLHGELRNPTKPLKEAAKYFRRYPLEVMATDGWKKAKQENFASICDIYEFLSRQK